MPHTASGIPVKRLLLAGCAALVLAGCETTSSAGPKISPEVAASSQANIASLSDVVARNPQDPEVYNTRGSALARAGKYKDAMVDFDTAIRLNPNFAQAYANRALAQVSLGQQQLALADYERAINANPNYVGPERRKGGKADVIRQTALLEKVRSG